MSVEREKPKSGASWLGGAEMFERERVHSLEGAERAEREGDEERARKLRGCAEEFRRNRDRVHRDEEMRILNRRSRRRMY